MLDLSNRLLNLKIEKKVLQKDIVLATGLSLRAYQYYEKGERVPPADALLAIADYFDVSTDYLLGRTNNPNSHKL